MSQQILRIALVILEDRQARVALQLRSNIPTIVNPNMWALFGGHIEAGEEPAAAAQREVEEELTCSLIGDKLTYLGEREFGGEKISYLFHYPITMELDEAGLTEGQRFDFFWPNQIRLAYIDRREIVPYHREFLLSFWNRDLKLTKN